MPTPRCDSISWRTPARHWRLACTDRRRSSWRVWTPSRMRRMPSGHAASTGAIPASRAPRAWRRWLRCCDRSTQQAKAYALAAGEKAAMCGILTYATFVQAALPDWPAWSASTPDVSAATDDPRAQSPHASPAGQAFGRGPSLHKARRRATLGEEFGNHGAWTISSMPLMFGFAALSATVPHGRDSSRTLEGTWSRCRTCGLAWTEWAALPLPHLGGQLSSRVEWVLPFRIGLSLAR